MKRIEAEELDYLYGKINFGASNLDAKAIDIMNRSMIIFRDLKIAHEAMKEFVLRVEDGEIKSHYTYNKFKQIIEK